MRKLSDPPASILDAETRRPNTGSFAGPLPRVDLAPMGRGSLFRIARHKRWVYVAIASDELFIAVAILRFGYVASAFAFALDKTRGVLSVDRSALGPPFAGRVSDTTGAGCEARFEFGGMRASFTRSEGAPSYALAVSAPDLRIDAELEARPLPPSIAAVAHLGDGLVNATEKRVLLPVRGEAILKGERFALDGSLGAFDYTHGYLPRHTAWRWAFALGRTKSGERMALNLVEGFVGEAECALWIDDQLHPLAEGRFTFDRNDPLAPWHVRTADGAVDLRFDPMGVHAEHKNFGIVRSRFVQPAGLFHGAIEVPGRASLELDGVLGVTEDQDVLW